ncbi:hypothetical protein IFM89_036378 [Coptis chinensis]|uniref:Uncharacterized protein n=1 Tax=Coptis chinensis TaxID=261450 RepID=A0A835H9T8_9MAGN|nr:hypothetical protein IFM89_036378 [Coptis chinensis]
MLDSPVGTGYSYVADDVNSSNLTIKTNEDTATDVTTLLKELFNANECLPQSPLYVVAESYGWKFTVTIGLSALKANEAGELKLKLGEVHHRGKFVTEALELYDAYTMKKKDIFYPTRVTYMSQMYYSDPFFDLRVGIKVIFYDTQTTEMITVAKAHGKVLVDIEHDSVNDGVVEDEGSQLHDKTYKHPVPEPVPTSNVACNGESSTQPIVITKCGICRQPGHNNRKTCTMPKPVPTDKRYKKKQRMP